MRRPARKINDLEFLGAACFGKKRHRPHQDVAPQGGRPAGERTGLAHAPQIAQQVERFVIGHGDLIHIDDRQREPGAREGLAIVLNCGEGRDARRNPAGDVRFRGVEGAAQGAERPLAEDRGDEQPVWLQGHARLGEGPDEIVRRMESQQTDEKIEALRRKRQRFGVGRKPQARLRQPRRGGVHGDDFVDLAGRREKVQKPAGAVERRNRKPPLHDLQPLHDVLHRPAVQEIEVREALRRARPPAGVKTFVENPGRRGHDGLIWSFCGRGGILFHVKPQILHRIRDWTAFGARRAIDLAMPPHCPVTQEDVASAGVLGAKAWGAVHFISDPACRRCGAPFSADYGEEVECPSCIAAPPDFDRARAAIVYDDASHQLVVRFKHGDRTDLAAMFGGWMARAADGMVTGSSILTPVPLHPRRLLARRFNQSALLAGAVARETGARLAVDGLVRRRATPPQKDLSAEGRRRNVAGAFALRNDAALALFKNAHAVLIDDVLTTGATLSAAARALKRAGAARVDALVLARVVKGGIGAI